MAKTETEALVSNIEALLALDAGGVLVPHGIGAMARQLFEQVVPALRACGPHSLAFGEHEIFGDKASIDEVIRLMGDNR